MSHTPGPWTEDRLYQSLNGKATEGEARLIASAPDLLAALKGILNCSSEQDADIRILVIIQIAKAAIALAESQPTLSPSGER